MTKQQLHDLYHKLNNLAYSTFDENNSVQRAGLAEAIELVESHIKNMEQEFDCE